MISSREMEETEEVEEGRLTASDIVAVESGTDGKTVEGPLNKSSALKKMQAKTLYEIIPKNKVNSNTDHNLLCL